MFKYIWYRLQVCRRQYYISIALDIFVFSNVSITYTYLYIIIQLFIVGLKSNWTGNPLFLFAKSGDFTRRTMRLWAAPGRGAVLSLKSRKQEGHDLGSVDWRPPPSPRMYFVRPIGSFCFPFHFQLTDFQHWKIGRSPTDARFLGFSGRNGRSGKIVRACPGLPSSAWCL